MSSHLQSTGRSGDQETPLDQRGDREIRRRHSINREIGEIRTHPSINREIGKSRSHLFNQPEIGEIRSHCSSNRGRSREIRMDIGK
jgi:hypothetical protein